MSLLVSLSNAVPESVWILTALALAGLTVALALDATGRQPTNDDLDPEGRL